MPYILSEVAKFIGTITLDSGTGRRGLTTATARRYVG